MTEPPALPQIITLLTADACHYDFGSGKWYVLGVFDRIAVERFPCTLGQFVLYIEANEGYGVIEFGFSVTDADEVAIPLFAPPRVRLTFADPLETVRSYVSVMPFAINKPGEYRLNLGYNGDILFSRRIAIVQEMQ